MSQRNDQHPTAWDVALIASVLIAWAVALVAGIYAIGVKIGAMVQALG